MEPSTTASHETPNEEKQSSDSRPFHRSIVLVNRGVSKKSNVGTLLRSMTAFDSKELGWVGSAHRFSTFGAQGTAGFTPLRRFDTLDKARKYYSGKGCDIIGVEITDDAKPIQSMPFKRDTVFLLGEEGHGLRPEELAICDSFVYIPQYGPGTASLNVVIAASIVLHHFAVWSGAPEQGREGFKFVVEPESEEPTRRHRMVMLEGDAETQEDMDKILQERRREKKEEEAQRDAIDDGLGLNELALGDEE